jgi:hypothetical protein
VTNPLLYLQNSHHFDDFHSVGLTVDTDSSLLHNMVGTVANTLDAGDTKNNVEKQSDLYF